MTDSTAAAAVGLDGKVQNWQDRLLDLGRRNRLINCPAAKPGKISRVAIAVRKPDAALLWKQLAGGRSPLVFPAPNAYGDNDNDPVDDGAKPVDDNSAHATDQGSITNQSLKETQKTLLNLMRKAKTFNEEKGLNALYLAFGFLNWRDGGDGTLPEARSPLLLVPVQLTQENLFSPFVLYRHDDETTRNEALAQKLSNEFGIIMPDCSDETDLDRYVEDVRKACAPMEHSVSLDVELSLFSFLKINMHRDLGSNADKIKSHPVIKTIAGDAQSLKTLTAGLSEIGSVCHDTADPRDVFSVVDSDSSQQDAILLAKRGKSFVLQGPPGTGKSQTITNIIAELLSDGKKVLFVSEKMAALEVVYKRLAAVGLKDFCLTLHSHNAKRREVLDQLEASLKLAETRIELSSSAFDKLAQLKERREHLNNYSRELHSTVEPLGKTIYEAHGELAALEDIPDITYVANDPKTYAPSDLAARLKLLGDYSRLISENGYMSDNPWAGCRLPHVTGLFRQQFQNESREALSIIGNAVLSANKHENKSPAALLSYNDCRKCADYVKLKRTLDAAREKIARYYNDDVLTINGEELLKRCNTKYRGFFKIFNSQYKADGKLIAASRKTPKKIIAADMLTLAENLRDLQKTQIEIGQLSQWIVQAHGVTAQSLATLYEQLEAHIKWISEQFAQEPLFSLMPLEDLYDRVKKCADNFADLERYVNYRDNIVKRSLEFGIYEYVRMVSISKPPIELIVPAFKKCFYRAWLDAVLPDHDAVRSFRGSGHDGDVAAFRELDKSHMEISKAALISRLISRLPDPFSPFASGRDELGLLKRELAKKRFMPTRKLIASLPHLLPALKPCMLMSPLSVSAYLGGGGYEFDAVIFDEASQVRTEDAICALFRAKQAIIVGDSKQLPPTEFFLAGRDDDPNEDGDDTDYGAFESLLDEAALLPSQTLRWHYRSKHEHLIAFSNAKIYGRRLITFPSCVENAEDAGVQYVHVPGGFYDRGGKNGNRAEADAVARLVFEHFDKYRSARSLGVIAFGTVQQEAIESALKRKRMEDPSFEHFFRDDPDREDFFIKNLETVQGDERDTIILSVGYAPDAAGKFYMNFGPLSSAGGERRLNVAVTRARHNVKLVCSIRPTDIDVKRASSEGAKLLRLYIDFAINGIKAVLGEAACNGNTVHESPFETAVYNFLAAHGYDVAAQAGCSGYRIDMAVRHPEHNGRFAIGIECDGAAYHSARTARERDRLRQSVLESMGWTIYRIWSTDWIKDPASAGAKLINAVNAAIENYHEPAIPEYPRAATASDYINVCDRPQTSPAAAPRSQYFGRPATDIPVSDFEDVMYRIAAQSYGIDKEGLFKLTSQSYGWQRRGDVIKNCLETAYRQLLKSGKIREAEGKVSA